MLEQSALAQPAALGNWRLEAAKDAVGECRRAGDIASWYTYCVFHMLRHRHAAMTPHQVIFKGTDAGAVWLGFAPCWCAVVVVGVNMVGATKPGVFWLTSITITILPYAESTVDSVDCSRFHACGPSRRYSTAVLQDPRLACHAFGLTRTRSKDESVRACAHHVYTSTRNGPLMHCNTPSMYLYIQEIYELNSIRK